MYSQTIEEGEYHWCAAQFRFLLLLLLLLLRCLLLNCKHQSSKSDVDAVVIGL